MADFFFGTITLVFNPATDSIIFTTTDGEASNFLFEQSGSNVTVTSLLDGRVATLSGVSIRQLSSFNFEFLGLSSLIAGDNTSSTITDDAAQVLVGTIVGDHMLGLGGDDNLSASDGNDYINGNAGNDTLNGGNGNDTIRGGQNDDFLIGDAGNDSLVGDKGNDLIQGNSGNDTLHGGDGNDTLQGVSGSNVMQGNKGNDFLSGTTGNDSMRGGKDNDTLDGGGGADTLEGDVGNDSIVLSPGANETAIARGGDGNDTITAVNANSLSILDINGNKGADSILGSTGRDSVRGGQDNDTIEGDQGNDTLVGDLGNDVLFGEEGDDSIFGGGGNDTLSGNTGDDGLFGESGDDLFDMEPVDLTERDTIDGGVGVDTLQFLGSVSATPSQLANVSGINIMQAPTGTLTLDDTVLANTDSGELVVVANSTATTNTALKTITLNTGAVSASFDVKIRVTDDEIFALTDGANNRVLVDTASAAASITGASGADTIIGGANADTIVSGQGVDQLTGGGGADEYKMILDVAAGNVIRNSNATDGVDILYDFKTSADGSAGDIIKLPDNITIPTDSDGNKTNVSYVVQSGSASNIAGVEALFTSGFTSTAGNGDIQIVNIISGAWIGRKFAAVGSNTELGYQSGEDFLIELAGTSESPFTFDIVDGNTVT